IAILLTYPAGRKESGEMKVFIGFLLFAFATADIYKWVGLPEQNFKLLDNLLNGEHSAIYLRVKFCWCETSNLRSLESLKPGLGNLRMSDDGEEKEGSGEGSGEPEGSGAGKPPPFKETIEDLVESLHTIIPALKILKEARDKKNHEYAQELVKAIKNGADDESIKKLLGYHVMKLHARCHLLKLAFARHANQSGLLDHLSSDDLDFTQMMGKVIGAAEKYGFDVFQAFVHIVHLKGLHNHPGARAIMAVGGLVADVACETKLDGLLNIVGKMIEKEDKDGDYDLSDKFIPFLYSQKSKFCKGRMMKAVAAHMASNKKDRAFLVVGDYVVDNMRRALLIGLAVHKELKKGEEKSEEPGEEKSEKPIGDKLKRLADFVEEELDQLPDTLKPASHH
ncbi:unnamed protein product, partial [Pocillopora meandrina]